MARAATTLDVFNAIAEPKRRRVLETLVETELPVNELVVHLGWSQPSVSKHLGVLKKVGLVSARRQGQQRVYSVNGGRLQPIYNWTRTFEKFWDHNLARIKERAERKAKG